MRTMVLAMENPSPVPPVARLIHAVEALEDVFQLVGRNAAALVAHGQARAVLVGLDGNANGSAGGRVAGGAVEKDEEQLAQQGFIRVYAQTGLHLRLIWMRGVDFTPLREQVVQKARNVDGFLFQRLRAVVAARQEQQVLRQVGHVFRLAADGRHAFIQHGGIVPSPAAEQLGIAPADFLYLGDTKVDMTCACSAGMNPVGVLWGFRTAQELLDNGAKVLISHPMELLEKFNL